MPYQFRRATLEDALTLCHHRRRMFEDMGHRDPELLDQLRSDFVNVDLFEACHFYAALISSPLDL